MKQVKILRLFSCHSHVLIAILVRALVFSMPSLPQIPDPFVTLLRLYSFSPANPRSFCYSLTFLL